MRRRGRSRDGERMDQYRAIHAEVISLSTVSGGSRVAWRRGVARCWRGVAWRGVACAHGGPRTLVPSRFLTLCFFPYILFLPLFFCFSPSPSISLFLSSSISPCCFSFAFLCLGRSRSPRWSALTGVKIEPLWRSSDSRTSLLAVLITLRNQC